MKHLILTAALTAACVAGSSLAADPAKVEQTTARETARDTWNFSVTLSHGDTGWDDYADGWRVVAPDGTVLGTRILAHPHVNEQPFTRSQSGIKIPADLGEVLIETSTNTEGWSGPKTTYKLPR